MARQPQQQNQPLMPEKILQKKLFNGQTYYRLKWPDKTRDTGWVQQSLMTNCDRLIQEFESAKGKQYEDEEDNEWEVEQILDKRQIKDKTQYLVRWKGWDGDPTWEDENNCNCLNLIAAFENPKFRKLWNFQGSNQNLWINGKTLHNYMKKHCVQNKHSLHYKAKFTFTSFTDSHDETDEDYTVINLLTFKPDYPDKELSPILYDGMNIGPLIYNNHWYIVIILKNYINITKMCLIGDALNTLIGTNSKYHPVVIRLRRLWPNIPIKPIRMTQMDRSDVCAYYVLAAFERALFLLNPRAEYIVDSVYFECNRAEAIRAKIHPASNGQISVALPRPDEFSGRPVCEFCYRKYNTMELLNTHILKRHITSTRPRKKVVDRSHSSTKINKRSLSQ